MNNEYRIGRVFNYIVNKNRSNISNDLRKDDLTHAEARIILILGNHGCLSQDELTKFLYIDKSAVTRMLQKMMEKGFVSKKQEMNDLRFFYIELTEKGKKMIAVVANVFEEHNEQMLQGISMEEEKELKRILEKISYNIGGIDEFK